MNLINLKNTGKEWLNKLLNENRVMTKPGSVTYLLYGTKISSQSINIKFGHLGEILLKNIIKLNDNLEILDCGIQKVGNVNLDVDLIWLDKVRKIIFIREVKANINLDTEKVPAIIDKLNNNFKTHFKNKFPDYSINIALLTWTLYKNNGIINKSKIKKFNDNSINVDYLEDFLKQTNFTWNEDDFYSYFKELGSIITEN
jgi:hypothetical protein